MDTMISETEILTVNASKRKRPVVTLCYSVVFITIEVMMQIVPFSLRHFNSTKTFAISSATLITAIELVKFISCFAAFCGHQRRLRFLPSPIFLVPAIFFVATSNLFFYCLNFITPPTWDVLVQSRVIFMALIGYVISGRPIGSRKWLATGLLVLAIILAVWFCPEVDAPKHLFDNIDRKNSTVWWILASLCGAVCSALSMNSSEYISRVDSRPITEKHTQLHFFCTVVSIVWAELVTNGNMFEVNTKVFFPLDFYLSSLTIATGALGGLAATFITVFRLAPSAEDPSITTAWIPPATLLSSAAVCSILFSSQSYPNGVLAVIVLLVGATSFLNASSSSSPQEKPNTSLRQEA